MITRAEWDFPVTMVNLKKATNNENVPARAIVRDDSGECLAVVGPKYHLLEHRDVFNPAQDLAERLSGILGCGYKLMDYIAKDGAIATRTIDFKEYQKGLADVGETVGFRIFVTNSYTGSGATLIRIGGLVLSCLNGMVREDKGSLGSVRAMHIESSMNKLVFPEADDFLRSFDNAIDVWGRFGSKRLSTGSVTDTYLPQLRASGAVSSRGAEKIMEHKHAHAWDLMQDVTHHITHDRDRLNNVSRVELLSKANTWFERTFL